MLEEAFASYPEKHSVWDKIKVPSGGLTLEGFRDWLAKEHKLKPDTKGVICNLKV